MLHNKETYGLAIPTTQKYDCTISFRSLSNMHDRIKTHVAEERERAGSLVALDRTLPDAVEVFEDEDKSALCRRRNCLSPDNKFLRDVWLNNGDVRVPKTSLGVRGGSLMEVVRAWRWARRDRMESNWRRGTRVSHIHMRMGHSQK